MRAPRCSSCSGQAHQLRGWSLPRGRRRRTAQNEGLLLCRAAKANVLLIGGGGREHALAWKLAQSPTCATLYCAPSNPGISAEPSVTGAPQLDVNSHEDVIRFCKQQGIDLVFVGPEAPLVAGLVDTLQNSEIATFGPTKAAAQLEGSKAFMKNLCKKYDIPTAFYETFTEAGPAHEYIRKQGAPIVVKASGLAAGKGVILAESVDAACAAVNNMLSGASFGDAGSTVVIEEFLQGEEASYFALVDGKSVLGLTSAQDHKRAYEGDTGPNTGGMGAYSPAPVVTPEIETQVMQEIVQRTADAMVAEGTPFQGVLFAGLMIKDGKAKLLEHNVRFGDPEVQCLVMRLQSDLLPVLLDAAQGGTDLQSVKLQWSDEAALTVVMAAKGYPGSYEKGTVISGLESADAMDGVKVFHAGTAGRDGHIVASGGRVLGVTAVGDTVAEAQQRAYAAVDQIHWPEGECRRDIGWRVAGPAH